MNQKHIRILGVSVLLVLLTACANTGFYHKNIMRGQVVKADNNSVVVCIGKDNGAKQGQVLNAYRIETVVAVEEGEEAFVKRLVGSVKIESVIDEHFAKVTVVDGDVERYDIVELVDKS